MVLVLNIIIELCLFIGAAGICVNITIPSLYAKQEIYRAAVVCCPEVVDQANQRWPLHVFWHGGGTGGEHLPRTFPYLRVIAAHGFCAAAPYSCEEDEFCQNGQTSFLEILKTIIFLNDTSTHSLPIDNRKPYSVSGSSTGGRVVLMLASLKDSPRTYLASTSISKSITSAMWLAIDQIEAFVADHPDPMYNDYFNPDVSHFDVTKSPVFIITSSGDNVEEPNSAWRTFQMLRTHEKVFVNFAGECHQQSIESHDEAPWVSYFSQIWALGNENAAQLIYGVGQGSIAKGDAFSVAKKGTKNLGNGIFGFVACSSKSRPLSLPITEDVSSLCAASRRQGQRKTGPVSTSPGDRASFAFAIAGQVEMRPPSPSPGDGASFAFAIVLFVLLIAALILMHRKRLAAALRHRTSSNLDQIELLSPP